VNKIIKKAIADLGWKKKVSPHTLRHSFASNLVKKDVHLVKIQKLLGHASLATTSVYTHTNLAELKDAVDHL
jgi:site-specific recombinase XerD